MKNNKRNNKNNKKIIKFLNLKTLKQSLKILEVPENWIINRIKLHAHKEETKVAMVVRPCWHAANVYYHLETT